MGEYLAENETVSLASTVLRKVKPRDLGGPLKGLPYSLLLSPKELGFHGELQHPVPEIISPLSKPALKLLPAHKVEVQGLL